VPGCAGWPFTTPGHPAAKSRCGVAAGNREGQREIARAEDRNRTDRNVPPPDVGARQRFPVRERGIDGRAHPLAAPHQLGKELQLAHRARPFAFQPCLREAGLGTRTLDEHVAERHDVVGHGFEETGARIWGRFRKAVECSLGERTGRLHMPGIGRAECRLQRVAGRWIDCMEAFVGSMLCRTDQDRSVDPDAACSHALAFCPFEQCSLARRLPRVRHGNLLACPSAGCCSFRSHGMSRSRARRR
jgi:hypothetical protein